MNRKKLYEQKRVIKPVSFSVEKDRDILAFIESMPEFSKWVKEKLRQEMQKK